jgi:hypothetical protein
VLMLKLKNKHIVHLFHLIWSQFFNFLLLDFMYGSLVFLLQIDLIVSSLGFKKGNL